jgi:hypothetical protein
MLSAFCLYRLGKRLVLGFFVVTSWRFEEMPPGHTRDDLVFLTVSFELQKRTSAFIGRMNWRGPIRLFREAN